MLPRPLAIYDPEDCPSAGPWRLVFPYTYEGKDFTLRIPNGFRFDLASIPRALWWLIAPFELSVAAAIVHDFLYSNCGLPPAGTCTPVRGFTRAQADWLLLEIMRREKVWWWRRALAYPAVRLFGWWPWRYR